MEENAALASSILDKFASASSQESILRYFKEILELLDLEPTYFSDFIPALKEQLTTIEFRDLISRYEKRAQSKYYNNGKACRRNGNRCRVLIIGGGPCGLRTAIEAQLMGARVIVIEKRTEFSRNNVLHLWPFIITDLRNLGVKRFCPRFCAGSIDHCSISQLQCILLKIALLVGVEFHEGIEFVGLCEPNSENGNSGWRGVFNPSDTKLSLLDFNVMIGANGRQKILPGFRHKELRAKLSIAITANFVNRRSAAEAKIQEISGVSFIYRQSFFTNLCEETGIDLENIVYYKGDTHYFVMTAKKHSLLWRNVFKENYADSETLLSPENIDQEELKSYTIDAVNYVTDGQLPNLEFALNSRNQPDVSIFDFTTMYAAENSCKIIEHKGHKLLMGLVGDSLLEPFWPTGSGCARGFLSSLDACWMIRSFARGDDPLDIIAERETVYRLLGQTTPENLNKDFNNYSIDPQSRYPNLVLGTVRPEQVQDLYSTDGIKSESIVSQPGVIVEKKLIQKPSGPKRPTRSQSMRLSNEKSEVNANAVPKWNLDYLLNWFQSILQAYGIQVNGIHDIFVSGHALCGLIHHFRPDLIPEYPFPPEIEEGIEPSDAAGFRNQIAYDFLHEEYNLPHVVSGNDSVQYVYENMEKLLNYLVEVYRLFKNCSLETLSPEIENKETFDLEIQVPKPNKKLSRSKTLPPAHPDAPFGCERGRSGSIVKRMQNHFDSKQNSIEFDFEVSKNSPLRRDRARDAEKCKLKAMEFISMIQLRKAEAEKEELAERRQNIVKAIKAVQAAEPVDGNSSDIGNANSGTKTAISNDDFFNEYNMRLWRSSVPSIEERRDKLENVFGPGIKKTSTMVEIPQQCIKEVLKSESNSQPGKINKDDWVMKLLSEKFAEGQGKRKVNLAFTKKCEKLEESEGTSSNIEHRDETVLENIESNCLSNSSSSSMLQHETEAVELEDLSKMHPKTYDPSLEVIIKSEDQDQKEEFPNKKIEKEKISEFESIDLELEDINEDDILSQLDDIELENLDAWAGKYI